MRQHNDDDYANNKIIEQEKSLYSHTDECAMINAFDKTPKNFATIFSF